MFWIDYTIIGIIIISSGISIIRGFIKEALSLSSWLLSFWAALMFHPFFATLLTGYITTLSIRLFTAFFILFMMTLILCTLASHLISRSVQRTGLAGIDKSLGATFGLLRGLTIVALLVLLAGATTIPSSDWWQNSLLLKYFEQISIRIKGVAPNDITKYIKFS